MSEKRPRGRPSEYDPAFCKTVVQLGKAGKSRAEIASALDCSRQTLANWEAAHPDFMDALRRAKDEELAWWEGKARTGLTQGSGFNASLWAKSMSGRFPSEPYRERVQLSGPGDGPIRQQIEVDLSGLSDEELDQLERIRSKIAQPGSDPSGEGAPED